MCLSEQHYRNFNVIFGTVIMAWCAERLFIYMATNNLRDTEELKELTASVIYASRMLREEAQKICEESLYLKSRRSLLLQSFRIRLQSMVNRNERSE